MMLIDFSDNLWGGIAYAIFVGVLLGVFYFAGLWWTVRRLGSSHYIAPLFLFSMLFRISVVMVSFYVFLGNDWRTLLLGLLGFFVLLLFATGIIRLKDNPVVIAPVLSIKDQHSSSGER